MKNLTNDEMCAALLVDLCTTCPIESAIMLYCACPQPFYLQSGAVEFDPTPYQAPHAMLKIASLYIYPGNEKIKPQCTVICCMI